MKKNHDEIRINISVLNALNKWVKRCTVLVQKINQLIFTFKQKN